MEIIVPTLFKIVLDLYSIEFKCTIKYYTKSNDDKGLQKHRFC